MINISAESVKAAATGRWPEILTNVGGITADALTGRNCPCPKCGGKDRFRFINPDAGAVLCNQCFSERNGDGLAAVQWATGKPFPEVVQAVADYLNLAPVHATNGHKPATTSKATKASKKQQQGFATAEEAAKWVAQKAGAVHVKAYAYRDAGGELVAYVVRLDLPDDAEGKRRKEFKALTLSDGGWVFRQMAGERPLYRLPRILKTTGVVFVCEGEKAADCGVSIGLNCTTSMHGSKSPDRTDWSPLAGRDILILPDADTDGAKYSETVAGILHKLDPRPTIRILNLPGLPAKGDLYEYVQDYNEAAEPSDIKAEIERLAALCPIWEPPAHSTSKPEATGSIPSTTSATTSDPVRVRNAIIITTDEGKEIHPVPMPKLLESIREATGDWPRRIGPSLFVDDGGSIGWLSSAAALCGFIGSKAGLPPEFVRSANCHTRDDVFSELRRTATAYRAVELLPHEPPIEGHYYACGVPDPGDGAALTELVGRFCPSTPEDAELIKSLFVTLLWGGGGGTRPAFLITSEDGRGAGKSKLAAMAGHLAGGMIELSAAEDASVIKQRLLSPDGQTKRIAVLDNVKTMRFSWAELESLITSPAISGKAMYVGEMSRPNNLCWIITLNGASLATDMAQRCILIHIKRPPYDPTWEEQTRAFITENRHRLIADLIGFLRSERKPLERHSRWGSWERDVLSRLNNPATIQTLIAERQNVADAEAEEATIIEEFFQKQLSKAGFSAYLDHYQIFIPSSVAARWLNWATGEQHKTVTAGKVILQKITEGSVKRLTECKSRTHGRGVYWTGKDFDPVDGETLTNLQDQIDEMRRHNSSSVHEMGSFQDT